MRCRKRCRQCTREGHKVRSSLREVTQSHESPELLHGIQHQFDFTLFPRPFHPAIRVACGCHVRRTRGKPTTAPTRTWSALLTARSIG